MRMQNGISTTHARRAGSPASDFEEWQHDAHDIKNILASISLIAAELVGSDANRPQLLGNRLERGCARILQICANEVMEGDDEGPQTVADVTNDVVDLANSLASDRVKVNTRGCAPVLTDKQSAALFRILANLTTNAVVAMDQSGGEITISSCAEQGILFIDVSDTGPGLFASDKPDPAYRQRASLPRSTGAGLSIAELMARRIGARLELVTTGSTGTTFRLTMPLEENHGPTIPDLGAAHKCHEYRSAR